MTMSAAQQIVYTIGHSNLEVDHFLSLLERHHIDAIADVRSSPFSRFNPQYNRDVIERELDRHGMAYVFLGDELGARRSERECYANGRADYSLILDAPAFKRGIERVVVGAEKMRVALMCAEKDPLDCHRCILVAPQLLKCGIEVRHILSDGSVESHASSEHRLTVRFKLGDQDLFRSAAESVAEAYRQQGEKIAYQESEMVVREEGPPYGD